MSINEYNFFEWKLKAELAAAEERRELEAWQREIDLDYNSKKRIYDMEAELLKLKREAFIADNPDHPYKNIMFLQVTAPPQKISITIL